MAIQKDKLRASIVQAGVNVILLCHAIGFAIVEQPDRCTWLLNADDSSRMIIGSGAIDMIIQAVVE